MISIIQELKSDFDTVICHSQDIPAVQSEEILEKWYEAKQDIIEAWDGKLIVETDYKVTFDLSPEEKRRRLDDFINTIWEVYDNGALANFLEFCEEDFFSNHLGKKYEYKGYVVPKGTKIIKAFKYFEADEKALYNLQTQASMIIQEDKVNGTLCMSVHPLDYLSSSENTHHWRSCHALDGDYRAGNLSYMLDRSTIVCYLKTDERLYKLPNFPESVPWNSKKWRMLLFLEDNRNALFAGRQYPFHSPVALEHVMKLFLKYFSNHSEHLWSDWMDDHIIDFPRAGTHRSRDRLLTGGRHVALNGRIYAMEDLVIDAPNSQHFNDLKYSSCYIPMYCYNYYPKKDDEKLHFSIGSKVPCLYCGKTHINTEASMVCLDCGADLGEGSNEYYTYCGCCERRVPREYVRWNESIEDYVCSDCYKTECKTCDHCEETWYMSDIVYNHEVGQYLCPCCSERYDAEHALPKIKWLDF